MTEPAPLVETTLTALGLEQNEDAISNLIAYALRVSPSFRNDWIRAVADLVTTGYDSWNVLTRRAAGQSGIPDLVVGGRGPRGGLLVVVENKLAADEGPDQTERYASDACLAALRKLCELEEPLHVAYVFLTLYPEQHPKCPKFTAITHSEMFRQLSSERIAESELADRLLREWRAVVDAFHARAAFGRTDRLLDVLGRDGRPDSGYLAFLTFLRGLDLPSGLELTEFFRGQNHGRYYYGAKFTKPAWSPEEWNGDPARFAGDRHFNVHFEAQYAVLQRRFTLYLHYETNPYLRQVDAQKLPAAARDRYLAGRAQFAERIRMAKIPQFTMGGRWNQLRRAEIDLKGLDVDESARVLVAFLGPAAEAVDGVLSELQFSRPRSGAVPRTY